MRNESKRKQNCGGNQVETRLSWILLIILSTFIFSPVRGPAFLGASVAKVTGISSRKSAGIQYYPAPSTSRCVFCFSTMWNKIYCLLVLLDLFVALGEWVSVCKWSQVTVHWQHPSLRQSIFSHAFNILILLFSPTDFTLSSIDLSNYIVSIFCTVCVESSRVEYVFCFLMDICRYDTAGINI
jgi:hypothetical protein